MRVIAIYVAWLIIIALATRMAFSTAIWDTETGQGIYLVLSGILGGLLTLVTTASIQNIKETAWKS